MIGDLNRRIVFQEEVKISDGAGGYISEWQDIVNVPEVFASVIPLSSAEILHFSRLQHQVNYQIIVRYRADIKSSMRIIHDDVIYDIKALNNVQGKSKYLRILANTEED